MEITTYKLDTDYYVVIFCICPIAKKGDNKNNRTKEHGWPQNKDYVGGETCWSSNWLYNICKCTKIISIESTSKYTS